MSIVSGFWWVDLCSIKTKQVWDWKSRTCLFSIHSVLPYLSWFSRRIWNLNFSARKQRVRNSLASLTAKRLGKSHLFFFCHYQYRSLSKSPLTALNQLTGISMKRHCYNCAIIVGFSLYWIAWPWLRWKAFQSVVFLASNRRGRWIRVL